MSQVEKLKARAYDLIATLEKTQQELRYINDEITKVEEKEKQSVTPISGAQ